MEIVSGDKIFMEEVSGTEEFTEEGKSMAKILRGKEVADALTAQMQKDTQALKEAGITPTLCIFRVGERPDDLAYERGATKRAETVGIAVKKVVLPGDVTQEVFDRTLRDLNEDDSIHGILLFRPLPGQLDNEKARQMLNPAKDIDGCTDLSLAGVFTNTKTGFPPCTAQAAMEILPTVVNCHTRTVDVPSITRQADILIAASGQLHSVTKEYTNPGQVVIDVGINWDAEKGGISGDVAFEDVEPFVQAITPVPGGVGSVTSCVLIGHVIEAAKRQGR